MRLSWCFIVAVIVDVYCCVLFMLSVCDAVAVAVVFIAAVSVGV